MPHTATARQLQVLRFIREFQDVRRKPPTGREIMEYFGWTSKSAVESHLQALERHRLIRRHRGQSRGIEVLQ